MLISSTTNQVISLADGAIDPCMYCTGDDCTHKLVDSPTCSDISSDHGSEDRASVKSPSHVPKSLLSPQSDTNLILEISNHSIPSSSLADLFSGSRFQGIQRCDGNRHEVSVEILHVDTKEYVLSGYLNIKELTEEYPEITTYFEGEIIGPRFPFLTRKWGVQKSIDADHWGRFPGFQHLMDRFNDDNFVYMPWDQDLIYMRWKELFLVPDHCVSNIDGASYDGFYYICYQRSTSKITGYYYYRGNTRASQHLTLDHIRQRSFSSFKFR